MAEMDRDGSPHQGEDEASADMNHGELLKVKPRNDPISSARHADDSDAASEDETEIERSERKKRLIDGHKSTSYIESLPAELRFEILSWMPDLPSLQSAVHASPVLHAQYREHRNTILRLCLGRELDGFYVDAHVHLMSRVSILGSPRGDGTIAEFLHQYGLCLSGSPGAPDMNSPRAGDMRWMAGFHNSIARPFARLYSNWALANLESAATSGSTMTGMMRSPDTRAQYGTALSRSEEIRLFRAIYRYESFHHLFGRNQGRRRGGFRFYTINELFCCLFNPWEVEAIGCVDEFVRNKYTDIFKQVKDDLDPKNPKFRQSNGVLNPNGSFCLETEWDDWMEGTVSRGLQTAVRMFTISNHELLLVKMERALTTQQQDDDSLKKTLSAIAQVGRRDVSDTFPDPRDRAEQRRDEMAFEGDAAPPDAPPFAWVLLWNGIYSNAYGEYVPESLIRTGYVFWDERRWIDEGAKNFVLKQWEGNPSYVEAILADRDWSPLEGETTTVEEFPNEDAEVSEGGEGQPGQAEDVTEPAGEWQDAGLAASQVDNLYLLHR
ncbi:hypothetical protein CORC01_02926 [Colletotrichum orchidophilum]|uniref:F-box domain-containing protein n=1 Tax=Colletotrichum orchidophilum TaxID=1209926 RepID=A0A1G4BK74_9PEZI|nr:uncharacterized protein CORC01_02926 [Colletotrichum orchidophilum]OHF01735.1 hypothetical protein CORC01_02926 [Colletotrichum orchidophilum]